MKILITGANGQLGSELVEKLNLNGHMVYGLNRKDLDICRFEVVLKTLTALRPDVVVNAAAFTNVDLCESMQEEANNINVTGVRNLAIATKCIDAVLIHFSTDYVFDGTGKIPYTEKAQTKPVNFYGQSKRLGEIEALKENHRTFVVRTSWLYGKNGTNFVKTMIRLGEENKSVSVVKDQVGSPTCVCDLVRFVMTIMETKAFGIYHFSNKGSCSWAQFAREIFKLTRAHCKVEEITTEAFGRPAARPAYSVLDTSLAEKTFGFQNRSWQVALNEFIQTYYLNGGQS